MVALETTAGLDDEGHAVDDDYFMPEFTEVCLTGPSNSAAVAAVAPACPVLPALIDPSPVRCPLFVRVCCPGRPRHRVLRV